VWKYSCFQGSALIAPGIYVLSTYNQTRNSMPRPSNPALEDVLGVQYPVLDHGYITLIDYMGNDDEIVRAARASISAGQKISDTKSLIRHLVKNRHTSPIEQVQMKFQVKMPIFIARQWVRHRTAKLSEFSGRYSKFECEFYVPTLDAIKAQSKVNKQGSDGELPEETKIKAQETLALNSAEAFDAYVGLIESGIARETARELLPVNMYTTMIWTMDLHNLLHFINLRMDSHAQYEIQKYAVVLAKFVYIGFPLLWEAFEDFTYGALTLSRLDIVALRLIGDFHGEKFSEECKTKVEEVFKNVSRSELNEFFEKLCLITGYMVDGQTKQG